MWKIYVQILMLFCQNLSASRGLRPLYLHQGLCPCTPLGALPQTPVIGSCSTRLPYVSDLCRHHFFCVKLRACLDPPLTSTEMGALSFNEHKGRNIASNATCPITIYFALKLCCRAWKIILHKLPCSPAYWRKWLEHTRWCVHSCEWGASLLLPPGCARAD